MNEGLTGLKLLEGEQSMTKYSFFGWTVPFNKFFTMKGNVRLFWYSQTLWTVCRLCIDALFESVQGPYAVAVLCRCHRNWWRSAPLLRLTPIGCKMGQAKWLHIPNQKVNLIITQNRKNYSGPVVHNTIKSPQRIGLISLCWGLFPLCCANFVVLWLVTVVLC